MNKKQSTQATFADQWIKKGPRESFLQKIDEVINWEPIAKVLKRNSKKLKIVGADPYPSLSMFKAILCQRWFELSDRGLEDALYYDLRVIQFSGFSVASEKPDHTTLNRFRNALLKQKLYKTLLDKLNIQLEDAGVLVKTGVIVDATLIDSSRRPRKIIEIMPEDRNEPKGDENKAYQVSYSDDVEARWVRKRNQPVYGFKASVATDTCHGFIRGGHVTGANESDMKQLERLLIELSIEEGTLIACDKGYASQENRKILKDMKLRDCIMNKAARNRPLTKSEVLVNKNISKFRYKVERCFGTLKRQYGFHQARYLGIIKTEMEFYLNAFAFNVKKFVNLVS